MKIAKQTVNGVDLAIVTSEEVVVADVQAALDLMATVRYEVDCDRIILRKSMFAESFFDLKTRLAGEILQKFSNYRMKMAIVGDFSAYTSKSLRDFIYESNNGSDFFFVPTEQEAIEKLSRAK
ncbi:MULTISPECIES: DUF4180 domain-containing protein [Brevibacillus]|uniref:DUF4180 domain-containing protein n=1 Tax=Brevibacillus TaxID=55080 RepID=UPI00040D12DB|nr:MULTISPECIES: DUF4180 domain-containing protein [Brevibacillus]